MRTLIRVDGPHWSDVEAKDRFVGTFVYDDGSTQIMSVAITDNNPDYHAFLEVSSVDAIDEYTQKLRDEMALRREQDTAAQADRNAQKKANTLFNAKIEAFEVPEVQAATTEQKARIRKATTTVEVVAVVATIIMAAQAAPVTDATPSA